MDNITEIIGQLTIEEKAGLCSGADFWHTKGVERLGIASVMVSDGPHGLRKQEEGADHLGIHDSIKAVCFPAACATACSFDRKLLYSMGEILGEECAAENVMASVGIMLVGLAAYDPTNWGAIINAARTKGLMNVKNIYILLYPLVCIIVFQIATLVLANGLDETLNPRLKVL